MSDEIRQERDFLLNALTFPSGFGTSSSNMLLSAITGKDPHPFDRPVDEHDWAGVERIYRAAPSHLKPKLKAIMDGWRDEDAA